MFPGIISSSIYMLSNRTFKICFKLSSDLLLRGPSDLACLFYPITSSQLAPWQLSNLLISFNSIRLSFVKLRLHVQSPYFIVGAFLWTRYQTTQSQVSHCSMVQKEQSFVFLFSYSSEIFAASKTPGAWACYHCSTFFFDSELVEVGNQVQ